MFTNTLKFEVKDCDPSTGEADPEGYEDEYQVEDIEVTTSDYIRPAYISDFNQTFEALGTEHEVIDTFALDKEKASSLKGKENHTSTHNWSLNWYTNTIIVHLAACTSIIELLGMQALESSESPKNNSVHILLLSGTFLDGTQVLARCKMTFNQNTGVAFELSIRSQDINVSQIVLLAIS